MDKPEAVVKRDMINFQIFPNPAPGKLVALTGLSNEGTNQINIYTIKGELSNVFLADGRSISLDLSNLNKGVYLVQVSNNLCRQTSKLIII